MKLRIVDFEVLTRHFTKFIDGKRKIHDKKQEFIKKMEPLKQEMEAIIKASSSNLIVDKNSQNQRLERFKKLQEDAVKVDNDFKFEFKKMNDELTVRVYDELEKIINEWSIQNDVDCIFGKIEVVFVKPEFEVTSQILELLKIKGLYSEQEDEQPENEKESV